MLSVRYKTANITALESLDERSFLTRPVRIVDYDPSWPILYEKEKKRILESVGNKLVGIEHIGSTAVLGLGSKPIIDMLAGNLGAPDAEECMLLLQDLGYTDVTPQPEEPDWYYCLSRAYRGEFSSLLNYHLHLMRFMSDFWKRHLLFRNYLRTHPETAQQYYELKKKLAGEYGSNRRGYTTAKTSFIKSVIDQACK